ncbi:MAG TPA: hypothetical protein VHE61_18240 [Opitutaceae bacterium]|nr:hypothetical protein [Opitutaceae bacterium]
MTTEPSPLIFAPARHGRLLAPSWPRSAGLVLFVFLVVWAAKLVAIGRYGTDLPYSDQWAKEGQLFYAPWFEQHAFWRNLFVPHNEHRIAPTLALNWALLLLGSDQWDARVQCVASAALHAALAAGLAAWALRRLRRPWALASTALIVLVTAPPIAWENVLGGFQSQFYFLAIFSVLAIAGLLGARPWSPAWLGGIVAGALACVSMGAGMLVAAPIAMIALLRLLARFRAPNATTTQAGDFTTLVAALGIGVVGWSFRSPAPWQDSFHAHSVGQYFIYAAQCLSWPAYGSPWLVVLFWAPWTMLAIRTMRRIAMRPAAAGDGSDRLREFALAGGIWVLTQVAAVTYARANIPGLPASRYGDICALGLIFNAFAIAALVSTSRRRELRLLAAAWFGAVAIAVGISTRDTIQTSLPDKRALSIAYEHAVQRFVLTDNYEALKQEPQLPFPSAEWLARILRDPTLRRLLPASVRVPLAIPHLAAPPPPAPPLSYRATRTVQAPGQWQSGPLAPSPGWWKIETAGDVGTPGAVLEFRAANDGRVLEPVAPTKPAGNSWRAAYIPAPKVPAILVARVAAPAHWLAFSEPVLISTLGYRTWRLTVYSPWLLWASFGGLIVFGWACRGREQPPSSDAAAIP